MIARLICWMMTIAMTVPMPVAKAEDGYDLWLRYARVDGATAARIATLEPGDVPEGCAVIEGQTFYGHDQVLDVRLSDGTRIAVRTGPRLDLRPEVVVNIHVQGPVVAYPHS